MIQRNVCLSTPVSLCKRSLDSNCTFFLIAGLRALTTVSVHQSTALSEVSSHCYPASSQNLQKMATSNLPPVETIPTLSTIERARILDTLFEPCVPLHTLSVGLLHDKTFASYDDLIASIGVQLTELSESPSTSDTTWLLSILSAHPRLGEQQVDSAQSRTEQEQLNTTWSDELERLKRLNAEYEKLFGFRYMYAACLLDMWQDVGVTDALFAFRTFVDGRGRAVILEYLQSRIERGDVDAEKAIAIKVTWEDHVNSRKLTAFGRPSAISLHPEPESCCQHLNK